MMSLFAEYSPDKWRRTPSVDPEWVTYETPSELYVQLTPVFDQGLVASFSLPSPEIDDLTIFIGELSQETSFEEYVQQVTAEMLSTWFDQAIRDRQRVHQRHMSILSLAQAGCVDWLPTLWGDIPENPLAGRECYLSSALTGERLDEKTAAFLAGEVLQPSIRLGGLPSRMLMYLCVGTYKIDLDDGSIFIPRDLEWFNLKRQDVPVPRTFAEISRMFHDILVDVRQELSARLREGDYPQSDFEEPTTEEMMSYLELLRYFTSSCVATEK